MCAALTSDDPSMPPTMAVIGCGNPNRSDDGVGSEIIRALRAGGLSRDARVRLLDAGTDGMGVMFAARGCRTLIIVDACRTGAEPGAVFQVPGSELEARHQPNLTLHDFRWDHALFAGRKMFGEDFPQDVMVFLVEAATLEFALGLSEPVAAASKTVIARIEQLVAKRLLAEPSAAAQLPITIVRGSVYLPHETYRTYFAGLEGVVLQRDDHRLVVLPVRHAPGGGYLIKYRNAKGDRVINAGDFFRNHGLSDDIEICAEANWNPSIAGLELANVFRPESP